MPEKKRPAGDRMPPALRRAQRGTDAAEDRLRAFFFQYRMLIFIIAVTVLAFAGRVAFWPFVSGDFAECLHPWMDEIRAARGFHSLHLQIGNYTAPYHYLMAAMSYIPGLNNLAVIKITSTVADFFMAGAGALLCWQLCKRRLKAAIAYAGLLCLPTVFLNSAAWGQCDAMYTTFILLMATFCLADQKALGLLCYGFALAIKLQAVFVLPALIMLWLCGRLRLRHLLCGAGAYVLAFVPAMVAGGSLEPLWRAYSMQTKVNALSSNIPNGASLFTGFIGEKLEMIATMLMMGTIIALGILALYCWQKRAAMAREGAFLLVTLCAVLVPFLLPAMKDRYYYVAEVLTLLYALWRPKRFFVPIALQVASLASYMSYLTGFENLLGRWNVLFVAVVPLTLLWDLRTALLAAPGTPGAAQNATLNATLGDGPAIPSPTPGGADG